MPELHKLTTPLGVRKSWASRSRWSPTGGCPGPRARHCRHPPDPEAGDGGPIARVQDGDIVRLDAEAGTLEVLVEAANSPRARRPWMMSQSHILMGRELFGAFRGAVGDSETGAGVFGDPGLTVPVPADAEKVVVG